MSKKIGILIGAVLLTALIAAAGFRAGSHLTHQKAVREETKGTTKEDQKETEDVPETGGGTLPKKEDPEETKEEPEIKFQDVSKYLDAHLTKEQQTRIQKETAAYLQETPLHEKHSPVVCLPYVETDEGMVSFYFKLPDGLLLAGYYYLEPELAAVKETAVTEELLKEKEQEKKKRQEELRLSEEAFSRMEGGAPEVTKAPAQAPAQAQAQAPGTGQAQTLPGGNPMPGGSAGREEQPVESATPPQEEAPSYPYSFVGFEGLFNYLPEAQVEELRGWISESLEEASIPEGRTVTLGPCQEEGGVLHTTISLDGGKTLKIEYDLNAGEATLWME